MGWFKHQLVLLVSSPLDEVLFLWMNNVTLLPTRVSMEVIVTIVSKLVYNLFRGLTAYPKDHWTLKTGYFEDPTPAIQVQNLPLEGPRSLGYLDRGCNPLEGPWTSQYPPGWRPHQVLRLVMGDWESSVGGPVGPYQL